MPGKPDVLADDTPRQNYTHSVLRRTLPGSRDPRRANTLNELEHLRARVRLAPFACAADGRFGVHRRVRIPAGAGRHPFRPTGPQFLPDLWRLTHRAFRL